MNESVPKKTYSSKSFIMGNLIQCIIIYQNELDLIVATASFLARINAKVARYMLVY